MRWRRITDDTLRNAKPGSCAYGAEEFCSIHKILNIIADEIKVYKYMPSYNSNMSQL